MNIVQTLKNIFLWFFVFRFDALKQNNRENRIKFDDSVHAFLSKIESNKKTLPTLSAVYRVKNAEPFLYMSIYSIAPICSEIIIVDNNSSDNTLEIANKIKSELSGRVDVKIYSYKQELAIAGPSYKIELETKGSLAEYYTYCFSKASSDYVMKCDAHLLYNPKGLLAIQSKLAKKVRVIIFRGVELYGLKLPLECYIFRNDHSFNYTDSECWEQVNFDFKLSMLEKFQCTIFSPLFLHYKRVVYSKMKHGSSLINQLYK